MAEIHSMDDVSNISESGLEPDVDFIHFKADSSAYL